MLRNGIKFYIILAITYTYDAVGNRTSKTTTVTGDISGMVNETVTEGSITYTYNAWNQLVSEKHNGNTSDYTYDKSGAISGIQGDKDITYTYDAKGRLTRYTTKENGITATTEYTYDYRGTRTSKTVDGKETRYITYSMKGLSYVLYETDALGNITTEYVRGHQLHTMTRDGATYVYLSDAHMDVRALADTEGNIVNRYRYDAWGNTLYAEETVENIYRYCQEAYDGESGNTYLRARYYSATTANFLSADAYAGSIENPMTLNKYAYAGANPVMYADPSGYAFTTFELSIRAAMESILIHMPQINLIGVLCGGLSAIDTALSGEGDVVESFFIGYGVGIAGASLMFGAVAIPAIMLEVKMMLAVVQSVSIGFGIQLAGEAWEEGNVPLAVFRSIMVTADIATFYMQFGPEIANGWRYYFGNTGGQSTASAAARVTSGHESGSKSSKGGTRTVNGFDTTVNTGKQGKHIIGNNNYIEGRSVFNGTVDDAQRLVDDFAGTGEWIGTNKERVNFGEVIGQYVNPATNEAVDTTVGIIHYSKTGTHIVPAQPIQ